MNILLQIETNLQGAFIMSNRPVRDQCREYPKESTFSDQTVPTERNGSYHFLFLFLPNSLYKWVGKWSILSKWNCKLWSDRTDRNKWTTSRGDPNIPVGKNRSEPYDFRPKLPVSLAWWKHPLSDCGYHCLSKLWRTWDEFNGRTST